jgi:hypothetical protein
VSLIKIAGLVFMADSWLDQIKPPVLDDELARHVSTVNFQPPQRKAISRPPDVKRHSDRHGIVRRLEYTDRAGNKLAVADAASGRCVGEVFHGLDCTNKNAY